jgi:UDP-glucose 4-epimerase
MGSNLEPVHGPERRVNSVVRRLAAIDHAEQKIGFRATVSVEEGLANLVSWWRTKQVAVPAVAVGR